MSVTDYMDRFVESVQFLDDRAVSQKNQEKLACLYVFLHILWLFMKSRSV